MDFYILGYAHTEYKHGWGMCAIDCFGFFVKAKFLKFGVPCLRVLVYLDIIIGLSKYDFLVPSRGKKYQAQFLCVPIEVWS